MKKTYKAQLNNKTYAIIACSVKGKTKELNQDSFLIYTEKDKIICVMADGLGSAVNSEIGSETICRVAVEIIRDIGINDDFPSILRKKWLEELLHKPISCDTTFKFIVLTFNEIIYGGIGDGWLIGIIDDNFLDVKSKEMFSNQTQSMMSVGYYDNFNVNRIKYGNVKVLSIATDGFSEDIESSNFKPFLLDALNELRVDYEQFVQSLENMIEEWPITSNQDDKSVIIIGEVK